MKLWQIADTSEGCYWWSKTRADAKGKAMEWMRTRPEVTQVQLCSYIVDTTTPKADALLYCLNTATPPYASYINEGYWSRSGRWYRSLRSDEPVQAQDE